MTYISYSDPIGSRSAQQAIRDANIRKLHSNSEEILAYVEETMVYTGQKKVTIKIAKKTLDKGNYRTVIAMKGLFAIFPHAPEVDLLMPFNPRSLRVKAEARGYKVTKKVSKLPFKSKRRIKKIVISREV